MGPPDSINLEKSPGLRLGLSRGRDWEFQRQWLSRNYPPEVTWQSLYSLEALRPGFWGAFYRLFSSLFTMSWSAWRGERLVGTVGWQASMGSANYLWLAAPPDADETALRLLLMYARSNVPPNARWSSTTRRSSPAGRSKKPVLRRIRP